MADDISTGELDRRLESHERRTDRIHAETDARITNLAREMVPLGLYQRAERDRDRQMQRLEDDHDEDVRQLREEIAQLRERPAMTLGKWVAVLGVVAAFLGVAITAWSTLRGST